MRLSNPFNYFSTVQNPFTTTGTKGHDVKTKAIIPLCAFVAVVVQVFEDQYSENSGCTVVN